MSSFIWRTTIFVFALTLSLQILITILYETSRTAWLFYEKSPSKELSKFYEKIEKNSWQTHRRDVLCYMCLTEIADTTTYARVAQLVEHDLAKVGAAGSSPVSRSFYFKRTSIGCPFLCPAGLVLFEVSAPLCTVSRSYFDVFSLLLAFFENRNLRFSKTKHFNRHLLNFMYCFRSPKKPFTRQIIHIVYTQISPLFLILLYIF